jgi:ABC-2 type transport system ATP-binding protein
MPPLFTLAGVTHCYGRTCALSDVSLEVDGGAIGLIGQNGAGKSTLIHILLGLLRPTTGRVQMLGQDLPAGAVWLRGQVGFMPERDAFVPGLTGIEYVALSGELCGMSRRQALRRGHETLFWVGLEEVRYRPLDQYSVGMRQRLKLAGTLVHDPDVLLLDEPTAGLDPEGRAAMLDVLRVLAARPNKSLVLSSHLLGDIEHVCQTAIILNEGRIVGTGRIPELREAPRCSYRMRCDGDEAGLLAALAAQGVEIRAGGRTGEYRVSVPEGWSNRNFFAAARHVQAILTGLEPEEEDLAAVYYRLVGFRDAKKP